MDLVDNQGCPGLCVVCSWLCGVWSWLCGVWSWLSVVCSWLCRVANNFKIPGAMWAPNWSSFTRPHWYFGAHNFNETLKVETKKKNYMHGIPWINFHIISMCTSSFDVGPMKSLTLENVSSVANSIPVNPQDLRGRLPIFWPVSRMRKFSRAWDENLPHDQIMDRFSFLPPLRHVFVVNISRISISLRNLQNKIEVKT